MVYKNGRITVYKNKEQQRCCKRKRASEVCAFKPSRRVGTCANTFQVNKFAKVGRERKKKLYLPCNVESCSEPPASKLPQLPITIRNYSTGFHGTGKREPVSKDALKNHCDGAIDVIDTPFGFCCQMYPIVSVNYSEHFLSPPLS